MKIQFALRQIGQYLGIKSLKNALKVFLMTSNTLLFGEINVMSKD